MFLRHLSFVCISMAVLAACGGDSTGTPAPSNDASASDASTSTPGPSNDGGSAGPSDGRAPSDSAANSDASSQEKLICDAYASRSACNGGAIPCDEDDKCIYGRVMLAD